MTQTESKPTSDNEQGQSPQTDQYTPPYLQQFEDETIDLSSFSSLESLLGRVVIFAFCFIQLNFF